MVSCFSKSAGRSDVGPSMKYNHSSVARILPWLLAAFCSAPWCTRAADREGETSRELELRFRLNPSTRLHVLTSLTRNNLESLREGALGVAFDRQLGPAWSYRIGGRYIGTSEEEADSVERRGIVDLTYRRSFARQWTLYNRTRADLRWVEDKPFSHRVRDRIMLERRTLIAGHDVDWYISHELYFDSRYGRLARDRAIVGVAIALNRNVTVDFSHSRTHQRFPDEEVTESVGLALVLQFGPSIEDAKGSRVDPELPRPVFFDRQDARASYNASL